MLISLRFNQVTQVTQVTEVPPGVPDRFSLESARFPRRIEIKLPVAVSERLAAISARTGRSQDELILELLDKGLRES